MTEASEPSRQPRLRRLWTLYIVLALSLLAGTAGTWYAYTSTRARAELQFRQAARFTREKIEGRIPVYLTMLRGASGLFAKDAHVSRDDFHNYVGRLQLHDNYPGTQGLGFSRYLPPEQEQAILEDI